MDDSLASKIRKEYFPEDSVEVLSAEEDSQQDVMESSIAAKYINRRRYCIEFMFLLLMLVLGAVAYYMRTVC